MGRMPRNHDRVFESRPEVREAWAQLNASVKAGMDLRRYELATLAAAMRLRSSYCSLAHGAVLLGLGEPVAAIARDRASAGLSPVDLAVMALAEKVVDDASAITDADRQELSDLGLTDEEILDVVLAAAARCFFSKTLDAMGALPDAEYRELDAALRDVLVVGRPIADA